ncbi:MAG: cyclic nucleotide-binding domain-containing protein [Nocardioides sp.]
MSTVRSTEHLLRSIPALATSSTRDLRRMAALMDVVSVPVGTALTTEGAFENQTFLLVEGSVAVTVGGDLVAELGPGDVVGELGVLDRHRRRTATTTARTPVLALVLTPRGLDSLLRGFPLAAALVRGAAAAHEAPLAG